MLWAASCSCVAAKFAFGKCLFTSLIRSVSWGTHRAKASNDVLPVTASWDTAVTRLVLAGVPLRLGSGLPVSGGGGQVSDVVPPPRDRLTALANVSLGS